MGIFIKRQPKKKARSLRILQEREASIGSNIFPVDKENGIEHQFHYLGRNEDGVPEWVWHRYWRDQSGREQVLTTRYEIQSDKIIKIQTGLSHREVDKREAQTLYDAICRYWKFVKADLYS